MKKPKFAVIGAGCGGQTFAGHLASEGYDVALYNRSPEKLGNLNEEKKISLEGVLNQEGNINIATTNLEEAVKDRDIIMVVTTATGHEEISKNMAPYLKDGQTIILNPGRTFGVLEFLNNIYQQRPNLDVTVGEANTLLYATRVTEPGKANVLGIKDEVSLSTLPNHKTQEVVDQLNEFYPSFRASENFLETSVGNIGAVFHPSIMLLNHDKIKNNEPFEFYTEGASEYVAGFMKEIDKERQQIAKKLRTTIPTLEEWLGSRYNLEQKELHLMLKENPAYQGIMAPTTMDHRYIFEDVPTGLVPLALTAKSLGIDTPYMDFLINYSSQLHNTNYWEKGRTLKKMGLNKDYITEQLGEIIHQNHYVGVS